MKRGDAIKIARMAERAGHHAVRIVMTWEGSIAESAESYCVETSNRCWMPPRYADLAAALVDSELERR